MTCPAQAQLVGCRESRAVRSVKLSLNPIAAGMEVKEKDTQVHGRSMSKSSGKKASSRKKKGAGKKAVQRKSSKKTGRKKASRTSTAAAKRKSRKKATGKKSRARKTAARKKAGQSPNVERVDASQGAGEAKVSPQEALDLSQSATAREPITEDLDSIADLSKVLDRQSPEAEADEESYDVTLDPSLDLPEEYRPGEYGRSSPGEADEEDSSAEEPGMVEEAEEEEDILDVLCAQGSSVDGAAKLMELSLQEMDASLGVARTPNLEVCDASMPTDACPNLGAHTSDADVEVLEELEDIATLDARENVLIRKEEPELLRAAPVDEASSKAADTADTADKDEAQQDLSLMAKIGKMRRGLLKWLFPFAPKGKET